jgi:hypothetical protein
MSSNITNLDGDEEVNLSQSVGEAHVQSEQVRHIFMPHYRCLLNYDLSAIVVQ